MQLFPLKPVVVPAAAGTVRPVIDLSAAPGATRAAIDTIEASRTLPLPAGAS
jgi:hypothetical protein